MLVDTSVWIDHLRRGNAALARWLKESEVWCHPFVVGELACGQLEARSEVLSLLSALPQAPLAGHEEVLAFVESNRLAGAGIGWIDAHLLAAARLAGVGLWTLDRPLVAVALELGLFVEPD
ncbi:MAG: type II toxin-antitoxin system VapC family toxin [Gemmatimonadota bacterium]|nr:MAG: type II toxin-antitoxin system VapC family toxin [Gemmatimonadota bacterium]